MSENQNDQTQKKDTPLANLAYGVLFIGFAIFLYYQFEGLETEGGSIRINWIIAIVYKIGGKWAAPVILSIMGAFYIYSGASGLLKKRETDEL